LRFVRVCTAHAARKNQWDLAITQCTAALELNPHYEKALARRAKAYEAKTAYADAIKDLTVLVEDHSRVKYGGDLARVHKLSEAQKEEMMGKLKEMGNSLLGNFGMSLDNFKATKDPATGSYSINFQQ
jgi:tetratricopeptide (TPR) repeat protein